MSIRWKLALLCLLLTLLPIVFLNKYAVQVFDVFTRKMLEEHMIDYAYVMSGDYMDVVRGVSSPGAFSERNRRFGREFNARLQIVDAEGTVLHDSSEEPELGADYAGRREVRKALLGHYGARYSLNSEGSRMYYYIALPVKDTNGAVMAASCVTAHTADITGRIIRIARDYRKILWVSVSASILLSILLAYTMTRRLKNLTKSVKDFAGGRAGLHVESQGHDEIGELSRAFAQLAEEIRQTSKQNRQLMAETTHELKTPLTAIQGAVQLLLEELEDADVETRRHFLHNIEISSSRLLCMVEQLNALSKLKAEELRGRKEQVEYGSFVREIISRLYQQSPVPIDIDIPNVKQHVLLIPERIEQVLVNLLDNAIRYTPQDGVIIVRVVYEKERVLTSVTDNGCGIEPTDLPNVFKQFFTTVPRNGFNEYGNGLGLAIASTIIQNHGGAITVKSHVGQGSTFTFTMPV